jgi:hypothetical protein
MNLTVGPLPPAVYWRRRAVVAGVLLVVILLIVYACGGSGSSGRDDQRHTAVEETRSPTPGPSPLVSASSSPSLASDLPSPSASDVSSAPSPSSGHGTPACSDRDIKVTATIESTSASTSRLQYGGTFSLQLKIQNISDRACSRDVGSVPESLVVLKNGDKVWSSDDCDSDKGAKKHDVRVFPPHIAISAQVNWNSYLNTSKSCAKRKTPAAKGEYQLVGHVGTATSATKTFTIG